MRFVKEKKKLVYSRILQKDETYILDLPESILRTVESKVRFEIYQELAQSDNKPFLTYSEKVEKLLDFTDAYYWFEDQLEFLFPHFTDYGTFLRTFLTNQEFKENATHIITNTPSLGISAIRIQKTNINDFFGSSETERKLNYISKLDKSPYIFFEQEGKEHLIYEDSNGIINVNRLVFIHKSDSDTCELELNEESDGTRRLLHLLPSIIDSIDKSKVYIIDEIDRSMHPILIKELLRLYLSRFSNNSGQMIFTTHESLIMDLNLLRQDEFWFVEKNDKTGSSEMYSLIQFKPRFDKNISKGYLDGKFGAIPFLTNPTW
jgi:AAA15 family ATPase/GTPase